MAEPSKYGTLLWRGRQIGNTERLADDSYYLEFTAPETDEDKTFEFYVTTHKDLETLKNYVVELYRKYEASNRKKPVVRKPVTEQTGDIVVTDWSKM